MDNTTIGEMDLEQIPKDFRPNNKQHKSPWAIILIIIVIIISGLFWFVKTKISIPPAPILPTTQKHQSVRPKDMTSDLEASIGDINIPDYSSSL